MRGCSAALSARVTAITALGTPPAPPSGFNGAAWVSAVQTANASFQAARAAARSTYVQAIASATTKAQRQDARLAYKAAISAALVARTNALVAAGRPPANHGHTK